MKPQMQKNINNNNKERKKKHETLVNGSPVYIRDFEEEPLTKNIFKEWIESFPPFDKQSKI
jgi:hypothetical protein